MRKIVSLSVLSTVLLASLVGCGATPLPSKSVEDTSGTPQLDSPSLYIETLYGSGDTQRIEQISLLCVEGYAFLRTTQGVAYDNNSSDARFPEKDADCEHTKLPEAEESGKK